MSRAQVGDERRERRRVVLTTVLQQDNFRDATAIARLALEWGVNANFSAYTPLRTRDTSLMIADEDVDEMKEVVEMAVVNPNGTLSPCGLHVREYPSYAALKRGFTATNKCSACFTSTGGNSERPSRHLLLDHVDYLRRRAEA